MILNSKIQNNYTLLTDSDIIQKEVSWLFYPYIPRGEVTILNSDPGSGKTYLANWICAMISQGNTFPLDNDKNTPGSGKVVYLSREDQYDTTIIPRYRACGGKENCLKFVSLQDMPDTFDSPLVDYLVDEEVDLIIFDAVSSFIGGANMNQSNEVRKALAPLLEKIAGTKTAVLLIAHNNKMGGVANPMYRLTGSIDFAAFVRSGLTIVKTEDNSFVMAQYKNNFLSNGRSLSFSLSENEDESIPGLVFDGISELSAEELTSGHKLVKKHSVVDEAAEFLYQKLKRNGGWARTRDLNAVMKRRGFKKTTLERARRIIGIRSETHYDKEEKKNIGYLFLPGIDYKDIDPQMSFFDDEPKSL